MTALFYIASILAVVSTFMAISRANAVHALLYLVVSLLGAAAVMAALGAPLAAALEVVVYAGAIMVLFVFVVMLLNLGPQASQIHGQPWLDLGLWMGPTLIALALLIELLLAFSGGGVNAATLEVGSKAVGIALYGPYLLAVELGSFLLMAGLIAAYHIGRREELEERKPT